MVSLSQRLTRIAAYIPSGAKVADIGTDHALLPVYLAQTGRVATVIAGELNDGPFAAAQKQVEQSRVGDVVHVRQGDGLSIVSPGEVDTIIIAGMGGPLICSILDKGLTVLQQTARLVLQPNVGEAGMRLWLRDHGWALLAEELIKEDGHFYEILVAEKGEGTAAKNEKLYSAFTLCDGVNVDEELLLDMGPMLVRQADELLLEKWADELRKLERIIGQLGRSTARDAVEKRKRLSQKRERIAEVLSCLSKRKR